MRHCKVLVAALLAILLAGCATGPTPPPTCDGKDRRPVNMPRQVGEFFPSCAAITA